MWKDLLTAYDGERITYDAIGNPLRYRGGMTFSWQAGRQMKTAKVGNQTYTMQYNQDGIRTSKVQSAGGTTGEQTVYFVEDGEILGEYRYNAGVKKLLYQFDANGRRIGFTYNGTQYYYRHNLQGDVIAIVDRNADTVAKYTYVPWGKVLSVTNAAGVAQASSSFIGNINPIRYRGYYYDTDLGLYYLQSRYYDPETGRFVNVDNQISIGDTSGLNLFAYCGDDPINHVDPSGQFWISAIIKAVVVVVAVAAAVAKVVCIVKETKRVQKELDTLPEPTADITESFRKTLKTNANTVKETTKNEGIIESGKRFYNKVRNKGEWDLKQLPEYQGTFRFNDLVIQGQDIGNINFGYTGKALGLPDSVLLAGAGFAQIKAGTSNFSFIMASNGDDLRDQIYIMYGIMLYNEDH